MSAALIQSIIRLLSYLPLRTIRRLGTWIGALAAKTEADAVRTTQANIDACFPDKTPLERNALVRESLTHTALIALEAGILWHWPLEKCQALWPEVSGSEFIEQAIAQGRGVLVLVPHFGNWEVLSLYLGRWGYTCLYDPPRLRGLDRPIRNARARTGGKLLPIGSNGIRGVLKTLRAGGLVALLPDQVPDAAGGVYAPFFGRQALTMTLSWKLLRQTGAVPVMGAAARTGNGFRIEFKNCEPGVSDEDPVVAATALNAGVEAMIRTHPSQYQWEYRRFKRPPPGVASLYERKSRRNRNVA